MQFNDFQTSYIVPINGINFTAVVNNGHVSLSPTFTTTSQFPVSVRSYADRFPHSGNLTGSEHVFYMYPDGVILGTHGGNLLTKISDKATINALLRKNGSQTFI